MNAKERKEIAGNSFLMRNSPSRNLFFHHSVEALLLLSSRAWGERSCPALLAADVMTGPTSSVVEGLASLLDYEMGQKFSE